MAENTIKHVITDGTGSKGAAGGTSKPMDGVKLARDIGQIYEKVAKETNNNLQKGISKELDTVLSKVLREIIRSQRGGAAGGTGVSDQEIRRIVKDSVKVITAEAGNALIKELQKVKPGQAGNSRELETIFKSLDRKIEGLAPAINTALSRAGIELNPQGLKIISNAVSGSLRGVVSKEFGTAMRDFSRTADNLVKGLGSAVRALESLSKIKKSGGGIDVKEAVTATKDIATLSKDFKTVSADFKALNQTVGRLAKDQKAIMAGVADAIKDMESNLKQKATSFVKSTPVLLDSKNWEKSSAELLKGWNDLREDLKKSIGGGTAISAPVSKEIKQLDTTMKDTNKKIDTLAKAVIEKPKAVAGPIKQDRQLSSIVAELTKVIKTVLQESRKEQDKRSDDVRLGAKAPAHIDTYVKERNDFIKAINSNQPVAIKEAAGRGLPGVDQKVLDQMRSLANEFQKAVNKPPQETNKIFADLKKNIENTVSSSFDKITKQHVKTQPPPKPRPDIAATQQSTRDVSLIIKQMDLLNSRLRGPAAVSAYPEAPIPATKGGVNLQFEGKYGPGQEKQKQLIKSRIDDMASSLVDLQSYILNTLNEEFDKAGAKWSVVKDGTEKGINDFFKILKGTNVKESGKYYGVDIANVEGIRKRLYQKGRGPSKTASPAALVNEITDVLSTELAAKFPSPGDLTAKIGEWLKVVTVDQIKQVKEIERFHDELVSIKKSDIKGVLPSGDLLKKLNTVLGNDKNTLEQVFKATIGRTEATRTLKEQKLVRTVSLPAARLTKSGAPVFQTSRGSERALQRFAVFKTGFEEMYEKLAEQQSLIYEKGFAEKIKKVGVKPKGILLDEAQSLSEEMLSDFAKANIDNFKQVRDQIVKAAEVKYAALGPKGGGQLIDKVNASLAQNAEKLNTATDPNEYRKTVDDLLASMKAAGLSMYDIVKSMDKIDFQNIYDIMQKVLKGGAGTGEPLKGLGEKPQFDKAIREYEKAITQIVQSLPLIEPGRPRRGFQQENVLNLLTRTSDVYAGERRKDLGPEAQKDFIKDLNVRFNEMIKEASITNKQLLQEGVRNISSLGIPESLAGKVEFYRPGQTDEGTKFLGALDALSTKMYTDIIPELAPFGAQFTQLGRNIAGTTNAISSSKAELDRLADEFKSTTLEGMGTEFPALRTSRESELISAGRLGTKGYGFNVLTELRHTAGTMEDQVLVSGNLANALTSITKTLVRPSPAGRIRGGLDTAPGVSDLQAGPVKDTDIQNVLDKIQEVLGVPEQYKGRADQAFIDEVQRAISVIRGEEVEVQQARLTEVFLNQFGRKFSSRYGSKGVSVTPSGLGDEQAGEISKILQAFPKAKVKVLTEEERKQAGLGVALMPRSMGELMSEVLDKYQKQLESEGIDVSTLKKMLIASGNKFVLEMFKDAENAIVIPEEAEQQRGVFDKASKAFEAITGQRLAGDKAAIGQIRDLFKKEVGGEVTKERAIDVRISSVGIGKRGLQPEVLEAITSNIAGVGKQGYTTLPSKLGQAQYEKLLGGGGKMGELSKVAQSLGYSTVGTPEEIQKLAEEVGAQKGKDPESAKLIAERAAALEAMSNYYTTVVDEFGKKRKSVVGEKFLSIVQETGETEDWSKSDIARGIKGASVDIPVFSAYATVFGEQSALMQEIAGTTNANQRKQLEFLKALQFMADDTGTLQDRQLQYLDKVGLEAVKYFDHSTGILSDMAGELNPRDLKDTIFDVKKFAKPFYVDIPKTGPKAQPGETEPFYVPGALARGTYSEELIAGERGVEDIGRRLQHVVNMAKKATELLDRPAAIEGDIKDLEEQLQKFLAAGDPRAAVIQTKLASRQAAKEKLLSGEGEIPGVVKGKVKELIGNYLKEAQDLKYSNDPNAQSRLQEIYDIVKGALSDAEAPAGAFRVKQGVQLPPGASELQNVEAFFGRQANKKGTQAALSESIGKAADLLIGKGPGAQDVYNTILKGIAELQQGKLENIESFKKILLSDPSFKSKVNNDPGNILNLLKQKQGYMKDEMQATTDQMYRLAKDISSGKGLELASKLGIDVEQELQFKYEQALDGLQKAKIDYFHSLARASVGKSGAIGTAVFSRKFPAEMKKATNAIVDRTEEFSTFQQTLSRLKSDLPADAVPALEKVMSDIGGLSEEHAKKIAVQRKTGHAVLKQHELGIPAGTAKKLPVEFEKQLQFDKKGVTRTSSKKVEGTLYDLLKYRQDLQKLLAEGESNFSDIAEQELEKTKAFVEAIRYPFTGVSSIVPYEAKLLEGQSGQKGKNTFVVPGAPDLDLNKFNEALKPMQDIIDDLAKQREDIFKKADATRQPADMNKVEALTDLINQLAKAVSEVTPKYAAHTAKLDFDGDAIAVHTARTEKSREEIERHQQSIAKYDKSLQSVYRDFFTADALKSQQPTGTAILAEMAESFYKKFPKEKGFDFLVKPFLTGQAAAGEKSPTLEYASRGEQLSILGLGDGITKTLSDVIKDIVPSGENRGKLLEKLDPFKETEDQLKAVNKPGGIEGRITFVEDIYKAIEDLDSQLSTSFVDSIKNAVTSRLFESKYRDAVEAQLFKIHTGIETEALYRLNRLSESNIGFGSGFVGEGAKFKPSKGFAKRNPILGITAGTTESGEIDQDAVARDFYAKFNEVFRFALQKGMDVKHAGGQTVSGVIERAVSKGSEGVNDLWKSITEDTTGTFGELTDFSKIVDKTNKMRLGEMPTEKIREDLMSLYDARGQDYSPAELATADRDTIVQKAIESMGLKSFFLEMSNQVREAAVEGIIKQVSQLSPEKQSRIGDKESYARAQIAKEMKEGGINVREHITVPKLPLYVLRQESSLGAQEGRYEAKHGKVDIPENIKFLRTGQKDAEKVLNKYKQAKATAQNIQDAIADASSGEGGGAYSELVKSTLDNIYRDQDIIEQEYKKLNAEGFDVSKIDRSLEHLAERVKTGTEIPAITSDILKKAPEEQAKQIEKLADLVGVPSLTKEEKLDVSSTMLKDFRRYAENIYSQKPDLTPEEINKNADEMAMKMADAAAVIYEMDRVIDVLGTRAQEGITLLSLFPQAGSLSKFEPKAATKKSYDFTKEMKDVATKGQAMRQVHKDMYTLGGAGMGPSGPGPSGPGGQFPMTGGVVPVHIRSVEQGVGVFFGGGAAQAAPTHAAGALTGQLNPEIANYRKTQEELQKFRDLTDQHGEASIKKLQETLLSKANTPEFKGIQQKFFPGTDPADLEGLKKQFFTDTLNVFTGSKFKGGGASVKELLKGNRAGSQLEAIMSQILGTDYSGGNPIALDMGTSLHAKMQKKIKDEAEAMGKGAEVEIEKFVFLKPKDFVDNVKGAITGFIDVAYKNAEGQITNISDIKTIGKFDTIANIIPEEGADLDTILNEDIPGNIRQKLEDYKSQLNVYLGALIKSGKAAPDVKASIDFIPSDDPELKTKPRSVRFGFDENRLKQDIEALKTARDLVTKYILDMSIPLEDVPEEHRALVEKMRRRTKGKSPGATIARNLKSYLAEQALKSTYGKPEEDESYIEKYVKLSQQANAFMKEHARRTPLRGMAAGQPMKEPPDVSDIDPEQFQSPIGPTPEERTISKTKVKSFVEPLRDQLKAMQELHDGSIALQTELSNLNFDDTLSQMHADIQAALAKGQPPPPGPEFANTLEQLTAGEYISFQESMKAWQLWRIARGDFLLKQAQEAEQVFELANKQGPATREFSDFKDRVEKVRNFIIKGLGKRTDIYTKDRRFLLPDKAEEAGVYQTPRQIFETSAQPFGEDDYTRGVYKNLLDKLESGTLDAPADEIKKIVDQLGDLDKAAEEVLSNTDLFKRSGKEIAEAYDFEKMAKRARVLREALAQYSKFNLSDEFQTDVDKKFQVRALLQYLKQIEQVYGNIDLKRVQGAPGDLGQLETGAIKVPKFLPAQQQDVLNKRNVQKLREYFSKSKEEGGPEIGQNFSYFAKVIDSAGNTIKNVRYDFKKYGEAVDEAGASVGRFTEKQRDLVASMQLAGGTFTSALKRVVMWGSAATLVYGGVAKLRESLSELADIEVSLAQLRMVMNPLRTDFDMLTKSAVGFAKDYGVSVNEVLRGMKIFAQQGLTQAEVIDRTKVSTLAANVTTLSAADATEALTAGMKAYGNELGSASMALDAWSETEAKHAITAADMANAIKKSAAAAKTAGFTFNELNGLVAGIGAVTRQTGKEIGTAVRFISRRLFSEQGPKALGTVGISTIEGDDNKKAFKVLDELHGKWKNLSDAQKLNIAQAIGGTRQYNSVIVAMENWNEVLSAVEHSTNSKGSAERRNIELMKTYTKQLEQTKAAATELSMSFGKAFLPLAKFSLKGLRGAIELINNIPGPVKAAGVAIASFLVFTAKGISIFDGLSESISKGFYVFKNFFDAFKAQGKVGIFEVLGKQIGSLDTRGLKTLAAGAGEALRPKGTTFIDQLGEFKSGIGKMGFILKSAGDSYNSMLAGFSKGVQGVGKSGADALDAFNDKLQKYAAAGQAISLFTPGFKDDFVSGMIQVAGAGSEVLERVLFRNLERIGGAGARLFGESFAKENSGLFKSILPLATTASIIATSIGPIYKGWTKAAKSAEDYAQAMHNTRDVQDTAIRDIQTAAEKYDDLDKRIKEVQSTAAKYQKDPGLLAQEVDYNAYKSPLLELQRIQKDARKVAFDYFKTNIAGIVALDKFGNVILNNTDTLRGYISVLEETKIKEAALTEVDIAGKFVEDLTTEGSAFFREIGDFLSEIPLLGNIDIGRTPFKALEEITSKINQLSAIKGDFPLASTMDEQMAGLVKTLDKVKSKYDSTFSGFETRLKSIRTTGLSRQAITDIFLDEKITPGYKLIVEYKGLDKLLGKNISPKAVAGTEILKRIFPDQANFLDVDSKLIIEKARQKGFNIRKATKDIASGSIATFAPEIAKQFNIAGNYAIVELDKTGNKVLTFFNEFTDNIQQVGLNDSNIGKLIDGVLPVTQIQQEFEDRVSILETAVTGAASGIAGISEKIFKKDFDLGARFLSDVPTTTLLQSSRGYAPGAGYTTKSPLENVNLGGVETTFADIVDKFFLDKLKDFNALKAQYAGAQQPGLDAEDVSISKTQFENLRAIQKELANNQVAVQYIALFKDFTKTMESSARALKENIDLEKVRLENFKVTGGLLAGVSEGLDNLDVGLRNLSDLNPQQRALREVPGYSDLAKSLKQYSTALEGKRENLLNIQRTRTQLGQLQDLYTALDVTMNPEDMDKLAVSIAATGSKPFGLLNDSMGQVKTSVDDQTTVIAAQTNKILSSLGDPGAAIELQSKGYEKIFKEAKDSTSKSFVSTAIDKLGKYRELATSQGKTGLVEDIDKSITALAIKLVKQSGGIGGIEKSDAWFSGNKQSLKIYDIVTKANSLFGKQTVKTDEVISKALANMGDDITKAQSSDGVTIAKTLNTLALSRKSAIEGGRTDEVIRINESMNKLSRALYDSAKTTEGIELAIKLAGADQITAGQVYQRAFSSLGVDLKGFMSRLGETKVETFKGSSDLQGEDRLALAVGDMNDILMSSSNTKEFKAMQKSILEGNKLSSEGLINSKRVAQGAAAFVTFEQFNKKASNKTIKNLEEQLNEVKENRKEAIKEGKPVGEYDKDIATIQGNIAKESKNLKMHEMAATFAAVTGGSAALARVIGQNEQLFTALGGAGVSMYLSMEAVSKMMGEDLPQDFSAMRSAVADATTEFRKTGKVSASTQKKIMEEGSKLGKDFKDEFKDLTGGSIDDFKKNIEKRFKEARESGKTLEGADLQAEVTKFAKTSGTKVDQNEIAKYTTTALTYAATGYLMDKVKFSADLKDQGRAAASQNELFEDLINRLPDQAKEVYNKLKEAYVKAAEDGNEENIKNVREATLNVTAIYSDLDKKLAEIFKSEKEDVDDISKEVKKLQDVIYSIHLYEEFKMQLEKMRDSITTVFEETDIKSKFSGGAILNPAVRGFAGEAELPLAKREMGPQQRFFASLTDSLLPELPADRKNLFVPEEEAANAAHIAVNNHVRSLQDSIRAYTAGFQINERLVSQLTELKARRRELVKSGEAEAKTLETLDGTINSTEKSINTLNDALTRFGTVYRVMIKFNDAMNAFGDSLENVRIDQAINSLDSFKKYKDNFDKLLGGSHPEALRMVSTMEELEAARGGMRLGPTATQYDVRRAQIGAQLATSTSGEQQDQLLNELRLLSEQRKRDIYSANQSFQNDMLRQQAGVFEQLARDMERLSQTEGVTGGEQKRLQQMRDSVLSILGKAAEVIQTPEGKKYKGFGEGELAGLYSLKSEIDKKIRERLPSDEMLDLKSSVADPIVSELQRQTDLLILLAKERNIPEVDKYLKDRETARAADLAKANNQRATEVGNILYPKSSQFSPSAYDKNESARLSKYKEPAIAPETFWEGVKRRAVAPKKSFLEYTIQDRKRKEEEEKLRELYGAPISSATGGKVFGEGGPKEDKVPAMLSPGEYVVKADSVNKLGVDALEHINKYGKMPKMANGGMISSIDDEFSTLRNNLKKAGIKTPDISNKEITLEDMVSELRGLGSFILDWLPLVGDAKSAQEFATGTDYATGEELDKLGRAGAGLAMVPFIPGTVKNIPKYIKKFSMAKALKKSAKSVPGAVPKNVKEATRVLDRLQKDYPAVADRFKNVTFDSAGDVRGAVEYDVDVLDALKSKSPQSLHLNPELLTDPEKLAEIEKVLAHEYAGHGKHLFLTEKTALDLAQSADPNAYKRFAELRKYEKLILESQPVTDYSAMYGDAYRYIDDMVDPDDIADVLESIEDMDVISLFNRNIQGKPIKAEAAKAALSDALKTKYVSEQFSEIAALVDMFDNTKGNLLTKQKRLAASGFNGTAIKQVTNNDALMDATRKLNASDILKSTEDFSSLAPELMAKGGIVGRLKDWLSTAKEFYGGNKLGTGQFGTSGYLKPKTLTTRELDAADDFDKIEKDVQERAEGGMIERLKEWLSTAKEFYGGGNRMAEGQFGTSGYLKPKSLTTKELDEALAFDKDVQERAEGGMIGRLKEWLSTAKEFYGGNREPSRQFGASGYLKPKNLTTKELDEAVDFDKIKEKIGSCGGGRIKKYAEGGPVRYFVGDASGAYEVNKEDYEKSLRNKEGISLPENAKLIDFPQVATYGAPMTDTANKSTMDDYVRHGVTLGSGPGAQERTGPKARFGEVTAMETNKKFMKEFEIAHANRMMSSTPIPRNELPEDNRALLAADPNIVRTAAFKSITDRIKMSTGPRPETRADRERQARADLFDKILETDPERIRNVLGNKRADLADRYRMLQYSMSKDDTYGNKTTNYPGFIGYSPATKLETIGRLLSKQDWSDADKLLVGQALRDKSILMKRDEVQEAAEKAKFNLSTSPRLAALASPALFDQYQNLLKQPQTNVDLIQKLKAQLEGKASDNDFVKIQQILDSPFKLKAYAEQVAALNNRASITTDEAKNILIDKAQGEKSIFSLPSLAKYSGGGPISKTGPVFAHKGEYIMPKGFALGGEVDGEVTKASLREISIKITGGDELAKQVVDAIESAKIQIDDTTKVKVDVDGVSIPVNTEGISIPVDSAGAADSLSAAIKTALSTVNLDTKTSAVGADSINELKDLVETVQDKIFVVKDEVNKLTTDLKETKVDMITTANVNSVVQNVVANAMNRVTTDIDINKENISSINSKMTALDSKYDYRVSRVEYDVRRSEDLATRN